MFWLIISLFPEPSLPPLLPFLNYVEKKYSKKRCKRNQTNCFVYYDLSPQNVCIYIVATFWKNESKNNHSRVFCPLSGYGGTCL